LDPWWTVPAQLDIQAAFINKDSYQKEVKIAASQKATLSCEVSDLTTEVKWFKDGKQLSSSKTVHMESKGKSRQLVLENVEKKDAGEYTCEVGNEKLHFKIQVTGMENILHCSFWLGPFGHQWLLLDTPNNLFTICTDKWNMSNLNSLLWVV